MSSLVFIFIIFVTSALTQDSRSSPKHYCYLKSPIDSTIFNFTTIQSDNSDSIISLNDFQHLRILFCRPLTNPCNGKQDYAVCLHDNNDKEIGVGKEPPKVAVESGKIMFKYTGDKCNETHNYTIDIEMKCNVAIEKLPHDMDIVYNREECGFQMTVETSAACPKRKEVECNLIDNTGYYNLRPLIDRASNYVIKLNDTASVILNICQSLLYGDHFNECNHETMVCLVNEANPEEPSYTRLGNVNDYVNFFSFEGAVYMDLTSDTLCGEGNSNRTIKTRIEFVCQEDAYNKLPEYVSGLGTCQYKFRWPTAAGCNELDLIKLSKTNRQPCKIRDPLDNQWYDLSNLRGNHSFESTEKDHAHYEFSVCGSLEKSHCSKSGIGICKYIKGQKIGVSRGMANSDLMWRKNQIFLNYTDGIGCGNHRRSYTTIYFNCANFDSVVIEDDDPCATIITWSTPNVCSQRCATTDHKFNLLNLREKNGNHHIQGETNATEYHVNVCEPLFDENYTNCTYGTGICKTTLNDKGKIINDLNLGSQEPGLKKAEDGRIYLRYVNGSVCEEDNSKNISTEITFTCDTDLHAVDQVFLGMGSRFFQRDSFDKFQRMIKGAPVFKRYKNCQYDFNWMTSFVCPDSNARLSKDCLVDGRYQVMNLTKLIRFSLIKINVNESSGTFNVLVSGKLNKCSGTLICDKEPWERKNLQPKHNRAKELVAFKFRNETQCKNDMLYKTLVNVWCKVWAGTGESLLLQNEECSIILDWSRNKTVGKSKKNVIEGKLQEESGSWAVIWSAVIALVVIPIIIIAYYGYYTKGEMCMELLRIFYCTSIYRLMRRRPVPTQVLPME